MDPTTSRTGVTAKPQFPQKSLRFPAFIADAVTCLLYSILLTRKILTAALSVAGKRPIQIIQADLQDQCPSWFQFPLRWLAFGFIVISNVPVETTTFCFNGFIYRFQSLLVV